MVASQRRLCCNYNYVRVFVEAWAEITYPPGMKTDGSVKYPMLLYV